MTGGVSLIGPTNASGFWLRCGLLVGLVVVTTARSKRRTALRSYVVAFVFLLALLHFRGYRLRGDGLWYYSFAHSLAFDLDVDLSNQYVRLGIDGASGSQRVRETGLPRYTFPVGGPVSWVPWIWLGHGAAFIANLHGVSTVYDGFSDPYFHTVAFGNLLIGWLGLLVLDRFLRRWFDDHVALLTTLGIGLGSFLGWYLAYHAIYTHALTFCLIAVFLERWSAGPETVKDYAVLGLVLGFATCVRWQNGVFGLLLAPALISRLRERNWTALGAFALGLSALLPQLLSWKQIFDRFYIGVPLGADYMRWGDPFLTETLFSSRHGLFSWSPLLLIAVIGLAGFVRRDLRVGVPLAAILLVLTYVNSSVADWWAGGSFGARRFDSVLPILALGLATSIAYGIDLVRRRPTAVIAVTLLLFLTGNALLMEQYRKGRIPVDDTMSWEAAAAGGLQDVFDAVGYPFSFPMNWMFARRYDRPRTQYDLLVGKYLFHRMGNLEGLIDIGRSDPPFIGNGWSGVHAWRDEPVDVRDAVGPRSGIFVPTDRAESLRVHIECAVPEGAEAGPIEVWLNGSRVGGFFPTEEMATHIVPTSAASWRRINLLELIPGTDTEGAPFLSVDALRFERIAP